VVVPYAEGALLARIRERGSVEVEYGEAGAHIVGQVPPAAAAALRRAAGIADEPDVEDWEAGDVEDVRDVASDGDGDDLDPDDELEDGGAAPD